MVQHQLRKKEKENNNIKILFNFSVQTDHTIQHKKPDIIVINKRENVDCIINIAITNDNNICQNNSSLHRSYGQNQDSVEIDKCRKITLPGTVHIVGGFLQIA